MSEEFTKTHTNAGVMDWDIGLVFIHIFLVVYLRQLDWFQFAEDVSPLIQEASSVLSNWGLLKDSPTQGLKPETPISQLELKKPLEISVLGALILNRRARGTTR